MIIDAKPKDLGLPTDAYVAVEEVHDVSFPTLQSQDWNFFQWQVLKIWCGIC